MKKCFFISIIGMFLVTISACNCSKRPTESSPREETSEEEAKPAPTLVVRQAGERMVKTVDGVEFAFRWCPPGSFMMGSPESEEGRLSWEAQHPVTLTQGFWMLETEATVGMYRQFVEETGHPSGLGYEEKGGWGLNSETGKAEQDPQYTWENNGFLQDDTHPVANVDWSDAQAFCAWLSEKLQEKVSLPTEAEWEYACRAGTTTSLNNGKDITSPLGECSSLDEVGWYRNNSDASTHSVGQKKPNSWGLYDMHGNVWEWCADWDGDPPDGNVTEPVGPTNDVERALRGGGWYGHAGVCRSADRINGTPTYRNSYLGFRVVLSP